MNPPPSGKAANAFRTIGEVVTETGVAAHILRYWERQVSALQPVRRAGDRRYYRAADVALIKELAQLINGQGYTLEGAARAVSAPRTGTTLSPLAKDSALETELGKAGHQGFLFNGGANAASGAISLGRIREVRDRLQSALDKLG